MSAFKDALVADRDLVFFNMGEFAEPHIVEGRKVCAVIDEPTLGESAAAAIGLAECDVVLFAKTEELPKARPAGESLNVDGREFSVVSWREDFGVAEIKLAQQTRG